MEVWGLCGFIVVIVYVTDVVRVFVLGFYE